MLKLLLVKNSNIDYCEHCKKQGKTTCGNDTIKYSCWESKREWETIERNPCLISGHIGTCRNCPVKVKCDKTL